MEASLFSPWLQLNIQKNFILRILYFLKILLKKPKQELFARLLIQACILTKTQDYLKKSILILMLIKFNLLSIGFQEAWMFYKTYYKKQKGNIVLGMKQLWLMLFLCLRFKVVKPVSELIQLNIPMCFQSIITQRIQMFLLKQNPKINQIFRNDYLITQSTFKKFIITNIINMNTLKNLPDKINWFPGHMRKALRNIQADTSTVDLFLQIRDARIPYSSRNPQFDQIIKKTQKSKIIIFNKFDLCQPKKTNKVISDYNQYGIPCFTVSTQKHDDMRKTIGYLKQSYEKKYRQVGVWFMICGMPNVGKSSLINQLRNISDLQNKRAAAKATASVCTTRGMHGLKILQNPLMWLVDTPGVMMPSNIYPELGVKMALLGIIKEQIVDKLYLIQYMMQYFEKQNNQEYYKILKVEKPTNAEDLLQNVRERYKFYDYDAAFDHILSLFRQGKLGKVTLDDPVEIQ